MGPPEGAQPHAGSQQRLAQDVDDVRRPLQLDGIEHQDDAELGIRGQLHRGRCGELAARAIRAWSSASAGPGSPRRHSEGFVLARRASASLSSACSRLSSACARLPRASAACSRASLRCVSAKIARPTAIASPTRDAIVTPSRRRCRRFASARSPARRRSVSCSARQPRIGAGENVVEDLVARVGGAVGGRERAQDALLRQAA